MDIVLEAKNLTKVYGSGEGTVHALRGVSVGIERGSFTAIIGKSGCGKSTLLQALGGLDAPTSGQVLLEGQSLYDLPDDELAWLRRHKAGLCVPGLQPSAGVHDKGQYSAAPHAG